MEGSLGLSHLSAVNRAATSPNCQPFAKPGIAFWTEASTTDTTIRHHLWQDPDYTPATTVVIPMGFQPFNTVVVNDQLLKPLLEWLVVFRAEYFSFFNQPFHFSPRFLALHLVGNYDVFNLSPLR
jgi:hypothetical protein